MYHKNLHYAMITVFFLTKKKMNPSGNFSYIQSLNNNNVESFVIPIINFNTTENRSSKIIQIFYILLSCAQIVEHGAVFC